MRIVIDASIAIKWVVPEPGSDAAGALRSEELTAPSLWTAEAANVLWRLARLGEMTAAQAFRRFAELMKAPITAVAIEPHIETALRLAADLRHPVYDCLYLAVALHHDTHVVTADRRFVAAAAGAHPGRVRLLAPQ